MAYGKRIYFEFNDDKGTTWNVDIYQEGYGGAASEVTAGGTPVSIRWIGDDWKNVIGSEATVTILSSDDLSWMNTADGSEIKVEVLKTSTLWWSGFALPDQYYDDLGHYPREFSFVASDGLGALDGVNFTDGDGDNYEGLEEIITVVANILQKTGLALDIRSAVNLFEDDMAQTDADDPLAQAQIVQDIFVDDELNPSNCYDVLDSILKTFQARIFQSGGVWWIIRVPEYDDDIDYRGFLYDGTYSYENTLTPAKVTDDSDFVMLAGGMIETAQAYRTIFLNQDFGKRESILRGWTFPSLEFEDATTLKHWTNTAGSGWQRYQWGDNYFMIALAITSWNSAKYFESDVVVVEASTDAWELSFDYGSTGASTTMRVRVLVGGSSNYTLKSDGTWDTGTNFLTVNPPQVSFSEMGRFSITINSIPDDGNLYVTFYTPVDANPYSVYIDNVRLFPLGASTSAYPDTAVSESTISSNNKTNLDFNLWMQDAPDVDNALLVYNGGIAVAGVPSDTWALKGAAAYRTLANWILNFEMPASIEPVYIFRGSIYGQSDYFNTIQLTEYGNKKFAWTDVEYNVRFAEWNGTAVELKGVFLPRSGARSGSQNTTSGRTIISTSGGGGGSITPTSGDTRAGSQVLTAGANTVTLKDAGGTAKPYPVGATYEVVYQFVTTDGYISNGVLSAKTVTQFTFTVDEAGTLTYITARK